MNRSYITNSDKGSQNIKNVHVNIHDFVQAQQFGGDMNAIKFASYDALQNDLRKHKTRRFPLQRAKADELLMAMLIHL